MLLFININKNTYMNNKENNNINIIPKVTYNNADIDKFIIYEENRNKSGVYR